MNLVIDIGNTASKIAVFEKGEIKDVIRSSNQSLEGLAALCNRYPIRKGILSSVISISENIRRQLSQLPFPILEFTYQTPVPIRNLYETPQTLGVDRLAAAVAAYTQKPHCPALVIDAGTCITYDFVDEHGQYQGGNISPGMEMRFKALHDFTDRLPHVTASGEKPAYGKSTETAIRSGVIRGIEHEIRGYIQQLKKNYPSLLVFLTGGNEISFDTNLKSGIFADGFLVLKGLNRILEYNDVI
ncbi:MAG: type III pantothenate kinase [Bacteroidaceae bacterium]|nr:type III pantothenate kinase [Bacteroidaceae bacterium]